MCIRACNHARLELVDELAKHVAVSERFEKYAPFSLLTAAEAGRARAHTAGTGPSAAAAPDALKSEQRAQSDLNLLPDGDGEVGWPPCEFLCEIR